MCQTRGILITDDTHAGSCQIGELLLRLPLPQTDVQIDPDFLIALAIGWALQPHSNREVPRVGGRPVGPERVRAGGLLGLRIGPMLTSPSAQPTVVAIIVATVVATVRVMVRKTASTTW
jgi:hypothetical protein